jgi:D-alanyl-D-alanine dipeptidase
MRGLQRSRRFVPVLPALVALAAFAGASACGTETGRPSAGTGESRAATTPDLVEVRTLDPDIREDIRYYGSDNFVGAPVDGYEAAKCLLSRPAARALARVQARLETRGYGLLVYDCYRPQRAVDHFVRWAEDTADVRTKAEHYPGVPKSRLFEEGYIAARSGHSRASTVDLTLVRIGPDGMPTPLDMGSPFDFFDPVSHTDSPDVTPAQHANRLRLKNAMEAGGFTNYADEWWHYTLDDEPYPDTYFDVVVK